MVERKWDKEGEKGETASGDRIEEEERDRDRETEKDRDGR